MYYLHYLDRARLSSLQQSVNAFWKAADVCMVLRDGFDRCDTLQELKFQCNDCTGPFRPSVTWIYQKRISMTFKVGDYQLCVEYASGLPGSADKRIVMIVNPLTSQKFCYYDTGYVAQGRITDPTDPKFGSLTGHSSNVYGARLPFEKCSSDSDCKNTGDKCEGGTTGGQVNTAIMKCRQYF